MTSGPTSLTDLVLGTVATSPGTGELPDATLAAITALLNHEQADIREASRQEAWVLAAFLVGPNGEDAPAADQLLRLVASLDGASADADAPAIPSAAAARTLGTERHVVPVGASPPAPGSTRGAQAQLLRAGGRKRSS